VDGVEGVFTNFLPLRRRVMPLLDLLAAEDAFVATAFLLLGPLLVLLLRCQSATASALA